MAWNVLVKIRTDLVFEEICAPKIATGGRHWILTSLSLERMKAPYVINATIFTEHHQFTNVIDVEGWMRTSHLQKFQLCKWNQIDNFLQLGWLSFWQTGPVMSFVLPKAICNTMMKLNARKCLAEMFIYSSICSVEWNAAHSMEPMKRIQYLT